MDGGMNMGFDQALWTQLFGMGVLWVTLHCSGMCGPIVTGLLVHCEQEAPGETSGQRTWRRVKNVLAYQLGRAGTYAVLGALAGGLGASFEQGLLPIAKLGAFIGAIILAILAIFKLSPKGTSWGSASWARIGRRLGRLMRSIDHIAPERGAKRMMLFGALMGFLPCVLMFWVLGLAVASSQVLQGALLMLALVGLTTPMMLAVATSTSWLGDRARRWTEPLIPWALLAASSWMLLVTAAANDLIPHLHKTFTLGGEPYMIMFW